MFLSANNFFWRVVRHGRRCTRTAQWRDLGRPEAALIGVQYRGNDSGARQARGSSRRPRAAPVDLRRHRPAGRIAARSGWSIEIDQTSASSPPGVEVLAEIPNLFGPGFTAQMTYYETARGAKVFAAGAFYFARRAHVDRVTSSVLENLWKRLARP